MLDRLLGNLALTGLVQVMELAPVVRLAADYGDLARRIAHQWLVTTEVIACASRDSVYGLSNASSVTVCLLGQGALGDHVAWRVLRNATSEHASYLLGGSEPFLKAHSSYVRRP